MKQVRKIVLAVLLLLNSTIVANAHDFEVDGIYYNIISSTEKTVKVTYKGNAYDEYSGEYSGTVTIPATVMRNGKIYTITSIGYYAFRDCAGLTNVDIPNSVTEIDISAFRDCTGLTNIIIPNSVTTMGSSVFQGCTSLTDAAISENLTKLEYSVFADCIGLKKIVIPNRIKRIDDGVFYNCSAATEILLGDSVAYIDIAAFESCESVKSIKIPKSVRFIASRVFNGCLSLENIEIPDNLMNVGYACFDNTAWFEKQPEGPVYIGNIFYEYKGVIPEGSHITIKDGTLGITSLGYWNSGLESITIPNSVSSIGHQVFEPTLWYQNQPDGFVYAGNVLLGYKGTMPTGTELVIKEGTTGVASGAFVECSSLIGVIFPNSLRNIDSQAFWKCDNLSGTLIIPNSVRRFGREAFYLCDKVEKIINLSDTELYAPNVKHIPLGVVMDGFIFGNLDSEPTLEEYVASDSYIILPEDYYGQCYSLSQAFRGREDIYSIIISNGVTKINDYAFEYCTNLQDVTLSGSVKTIGKYAFADCHRLSNISFVNGIESIGDGAFQACEIQNVNIDDINTWCNIRFESYTSNPLSNFANLCIDYWPIRDIIIPYGVEKINAYAFFAGCIYSVAIPETVETIEDYAFGSCYQMVWMNLPDNLKTIGDRAFWSSGIMGELVIPASVETIGDGAFENCTQLTNLTLAGNIRNIGNSAFGSCQNLASISLLGQVDSIGWGAFAGCELLERISIKDVVTLCNIEFANDYSNPLIYARMLYVDNEMVTDLYIPDGVTDIKSYTFYNCNIASVLFPESVKTVGFHSFHGCSSLVNVEIPYGVTTLGTSAFIYCDNLAKITIPNSVTTIGDYAFGSCISLKEIYSLAKIPPTIYSGTFNNVNATLYVPNGAKAAYQAADYWKNFTNIVEMDYTDIDEIEADDSFNGLRDTYYDLKGSVVENPTKGIYIYNGKKVLVQ